MDGGEDEESAQRDAGVRVEIILGSRGSADRAGAAAALALNLRGTFNFHVQHDHVVHGCLLHAFSLIALYSSGLSCQASIPIDSRFSHEAEHINNPTNACIAPSSPSAVPSVLNHPKMMRVLEANAPPKQTAADTISTLSSRLSSATLLEDRRAAILGLRSFAKEYPASVASGALRGLIASLTKDADDVDTLKVVLETLLALFHPNEDSPEAADEIHMWLADEFTMVRAGAVLDTTRLSLLAPR